MLTVEELQKLILLSGGDVKADFERYDLGYLSGSVSVAGRRNVTATVHNLEYLVLLLNQKLDIRAEPLVKVEPKLEELVEELYGSHQNS